MIYPGDIVKLKTGGPEMTVEKLYRSGYTPSRVLCSWFDKDNNLHREIFTQDALLVKRVKKT